MLHTKTWEQALQAMIRRLHCHQSQARTYKAFPPGVPSQSSSSSSQRTTPSVHSRQQQQVPTQRPIQSRPFPPRPRPSPIASTFPPKRTPATPLNGNSTQAPRASTQAQSTSTSTSPDNAPRLKPQATSQATPQQKPSSGKQKPKNEQIQASHVMLVSENGTMIGLTSLSEALKSIDRSTHDLVQVSQPSSSTDPPTARILSKKLLFEKQKLQHTLKVKAQKASVIKEVEIGTNISPHDLSLKLNKAKEFFGKEYKVMIRIVDRTKGVKRCEGMKEIVMKELEGFGVAYDEKVVNMSGSRVNIMFKPKSSSASK